MSVYSIYPVATYPLSVTCRTRSSPYWKGRSRSQIGNNTRYGETLSEAYVPYTDRDTTTDVH